MEGWRALGAGGTSENEERRVVSSLISQRGTIEFSSALGITVCTSGCETFTDLVFGTVGILDVATMRKPSAASSTTGSEA